MTRPVTLTVAPDGIAWLELVGDGDRPPTLDEAVLEAAAAAVDECTRRSGLRAVVLASRARDVFCAGADLAALRALCERPDAADAVTALSTRGQAVLLALERLAVPTVALIDGACLGGGLELALACRWRLATDRPPVRLGLPEVRLGLVPGLGGTQRLPRLVGLAPSLALMLEGRILNARQAHDAGLVDAVVPAEAARIAAAAFARRCAEGHGPRRGPAPRWRRWLEATAAGRALVFGRAARAIAARDGHYPAPTELRQAVQAGCDTPGPRGYAAEAAALGRCAATPQARHLIDLFLASRAAGRDEPPRRPPPHVARTTGTVAVLGAGVMGAGIAHWAAARGLRVVLRDLTGPDCARGLATIAAIVRRAERGGHVTRREGAALLRRITARTDLRGFEHADVVIEAIVEDAAVKRAALAEVESAMAPDALLATNTSTLRVADLAGALRRPERFCGLHFFNPVRRMELVEVVAGAATASATLATAVHLVRHTLGRTPVVTADASGFLVNRCLAPYLAEAAACAEAGADPASVDVALERFGMPMGPFAVIAAVGLWTARKAAAELRRAFGGRHAPTRLLEFLDPARLQGPDRRPLDLAHWRAAIGRAAAAGGVARRPVVPTAEIVERCVLALVNEAAWALGEGVVADATAVDLGLVLGAGFAPWTGGPCRWADAQGAGHVVERLRQLAALHGERFTPAPWLVARAAAGRGFYA